MGKRKYIYIPRAAEAALTRALIWDGRTRMFDHWMAELYHEQFRVDVPGVDTVRVAMVSVSMNAWREVMLWALGTGVEQVNVLKQAAARRFLKMDGDIQSSVMSMLELSGTSPGQWESKVENSFRNEIRRAFYGEMPEGFEELDEE